MKEACLIADIDLTRGYRRYRLNKEMFFENDYWEELKHILDKNIDAFEEKWQTNLITLYSPNKNNATDLFLYKINLK